jgi:hypothetical protein
MDIAELSILIISVAMLSAGISVAVFAFRITRELTK